MDENQISQSRKTSEGSRQYLSFQSTFYNSHLKKDGTEYWSEGFSQSFLQQIIDACNTSGMPAQLSIKLKLSNNNVFKTIKLVILPTLIHSNIKNGTDAHRLAYYSTPELIIQDTQAAKKKNKKEFDDLSKQYEEDINEYLRIELVEMYYILKRDGVNSKTVKEVLSYLKNLTIVKEKYDLDKISNESVSPLKLFERPGESFEDLLYHFAKKHATQNRQNNSIAAVYGFHTNFVGLEKPQTPEDIDKYAKRFVEMSNFRRTLIHESTYMDSYKKRGPHPYTSSKPLVSLPESEPLGFQP